jgi:hypothetical protein
MRFLRPIFALVLVAILAACGSSPVTLTYGDEKNPSRVTAVTGLKSHDAANVITYAGYTDAQVKKPQKAVCSLKAVPGQVISGLGEFTCWAHETDQMARPVQADGELMQAAKAFREGVGGTLKDAAPVAAAVILAGDRKDARQVGLQQSQIEAETVRQQNNLQHSTQTQMMNILESKIPDPDPTP